MEEKIELIKKHLTEIAEELFKQYGADSYQLRCMIYDVKDSVSKLHNHTVSKCFEEKEFCDCGRSDKVVHCMICDAPTK